MTSVAQNNSKNFAVSVFEMGIYHHRRGELLDAGRLYRLTGTLAPGIAEIEHSIGVVSYQLGNYADAVEHIEKALKKNPKNPVFLVNLGNSLQESNRVDDAIDCYRRATIIDSTRAEAYFNLGNALGKKRLLSEAVLEYGEAISRNPQYVDARINRGIVLLQLGLVNDALADFDAAISIDKLSSKASINRGIALQTLDRLSDALSAFDVAVSNDATNPEAWYNRGRVLFELGRTAEALRDFDRAISFRPDYAVANAAKAVALLQSGKLEEGWRQFEWRWDSPGGPQKRPLRGARWTGTQDLHGKTILLYAEQGLGDTIQFCRYASMIKRLGARVILQVQKPLIALMKTLEGIDQIVTLDSEVPCYDFECPLMSLPLAFNTIVETIPRETPYLKSNSCDVQRWKKYLGDEGFKVAISWQGNVRNPLDKGRSFPVTLFRELADVTGVRLISLQKNFGAEQLESPTSGVKIETLPADFDKAGREFVDSAAVMQCVDLVISSDSALTHLAGALGVPAWLALKAVPDWRWMLRGEHCAWYPNHRLYRQSVAGDYVSVFRLMANDLREYRVLGVKGD